MSKSLTILALIVALVAGCATQGQFLASRQETAIQTALTRGRFDLNCPSATGEVLSQEVTQPAIQGPVHGRRTTRPVYHRRCGCNQRQVYQVVCPMGGDSCVALEGRVQ